MRDDNKGPGNYGAFAGNVRVGGILGMMSCGLADRNTKRRSHVFEQLQQVQEEFGSISSSAIQEIAQCGGTCQGAVRGVASFYSMLDVDEQAEEDGSLTDVRRVIRICDGPSCCLVGGSELMTELSELADSTAGVRVERTSCLGHCERAPVVSMERRAGYDSSEDVVDASSASSTFQVTQIQPGTVDDLSTLKPERLDVPRLLVGNVADVKRSTLTAKIGLVDPRSIQSALSAGAYLALTQALETEPQALVDSVEVSGLCGRGGAGFNTGQKWRMAATTEAERRFVICNADESEPGTFKDRVLMETDPHLLLEGMAICGRAVGASEGMIYIRGEYTAAADLLEHAIREARETGFLGDHIQGSEFCFDAQIHRGAGAYICGEETAMLESLEGKRGEPRERPPYPTTHGYLAMPTVVNNVETFCSVPPIVHDGPQNFRMLGCNGAAGTKLFCLSGHVARPGVCEAPMGISLRQVIDEFGGGVLGGREFKFALTGGAAGTFVPASLIDTPLDYEAWSDGVAIGSGAIIVADQTVSAAAMLLWVVRFFEKESCGKCTPCRIGTVQARQILEKIVAGQENIDDIERLLSLARSLDQASFCGLGQSVAWPIESAIKHFRSDFETKD